MFFKNKQQNSNNAQNDLMQAGNGEMVVMPSQGNGFAQEAFEQHIVPQQYNNAQPFPQPNQFPNQQQFGNVAQGQPTPQMVYQQNNYGVMPNQNQGFPMGGPAYGATYQNAGTMERSGVPKEVPSVVQSEYNLTMMATAISLIIWIAVLGVSGYFGYREWQEGHGQIIKFILPGIGVLVGLYRVASAIHLRVMTKKELSAVKMQFQNGFHVIPEFIKNMCKNLTNRGVDINWFAWTSYIILGGFIIGTQQLNGWTIPLINHTLNFENLSQHIFFSQIGFVVILAFHLALSFWYKVRKDKINVAFNGQAVSSQEISDIKSKRNAHYRRILKWFFIILGIVFFGIYKLLKRPR